MANNQTDYCIICCNNYHHSDHAKTKTVDKTVDKTCSFICDSGSKCKLKSINEELCELHLSYRTKIECPFCFQNCCKICYRTYFLNIPEEPHCIFENCKKGFNFEFLLGYEKDGNQRFSSKFIWGPLKEHRENVLLEQIIARLPTFQHTVTKQIKKEQWKGKFNQIEERIKNITEQNVKILRKVVVYEEYSEFVEETKELYKMFKKNKIRLSKLSTLKDKINNQRYIMLRDDYNQQNQQKEDEIKKTHGSCLNRDKGCNGFINHEWECGVCSLKVCSKCYNQKEKNHECDPNELESIKALKDISKACPGCNQMIERTMGCFAENTEVLMYDGYIKMSQDIAVGDVLIGDDGNKRIVQECFSGKDEMYKVTQNNGNDYTVNSKHTLVLTNTNNEIIQMTVDDYMSLSDFKKSLLYGIKSSNGVNYEDKEVKIDPYILGLWFGELENSHSIPSEQLREYNLVGPTLKNRNKSFIPLDYLVNSRKIRLQLLAGLIDSRIGNVNDDRTIATIHQSRICLFDDMVLLVKSLGFVPKTNPQQRAGSINISGPHLKEIPTKVKCIGTILEQTSIKVEHVGYGKYYGWKVDQNNLFIAPDMTILKNCSMMWCTNCHNFFDWNTLKIINKTQYTHNPEHIAWIARNTITNTNTVQHNGDAILDACNLYYDHFTELYISKEAQDILIETLRFCNEIRDEINQYVDPFQNNIEKHAVNFLRGKIQKNDLKKLIQRNFKSSKKTEFTNMHRTMYIDTARNILVHCVNEINSVDQQKIEKGLHLREDKEEILKNTFSILNNLREYTEKNLQNLGNIFNSEKPSLSIRNSEKGFYTGFIKQLQNLRTKDFYLRFDTRQILYYLAKTESESDLIDFLKKNPKWFPSEEEYNEARKAYVQDYMT